MRAEAMSDLDDFLDVTAGWRAANPLTTNFISTIAMNHLAGAGFVERVDGWLVTADDGTVVGAGLAADPYEFNVGPMPAAAARALGLALGQANIDLREARGTQAQVLAFAEGVRDGTNGALGFTVSATAEGLYELHELNEPDVDGEPRRVNESDLDLVTRWIIDFARDAGVPSHEPEKRARAYVGRRGMLLWEVDGRPVSMSGQAPIVEVGVTRVGRVGPVYTPPEHRGRGYGSAVTAAASTDFVQAGVRVMLFTDLANRTSNAIYQRLGYELVDTIRNIEFG